MPVTDPEPSAFPHPTTVRSVPAPYDLVPGGIISEHTPGSRGMTLRDWFASVALVALVLDQQMDAEYDDPGELATQAYDLAGMMMLVREQRPGSTPPAWNPPRRRPPPT